MQTCTQCGLDFPSEEFQGHNTQCKGCKAAGTKARRKTIPGLIRYIYNNQRMTSRKIGRPLPSYTMDDLLEWAVRQPIFFTLFDAWRDAGYPSELIPSVDRIKNEKPYEMGNIQLMTWKANFEKARRENVLGSSVPKIAKAVRQLSIDGQLIAEFPSISVAVRRVASPARTSISHITDVCNGKWKTAYGFRWEWV